MSHTPHNMLFLFTTAVIISTMASKASASGISCNAEYDKNVFQKCKICHSTTSSEGHGAGPNLTGVVGREAGSVAGFKFSKALRESRIVWNKNELDAFLESPQKKIPRNHMAFSGLKKKADRSAVICYLKSLAPATQ